MQNQLKKVAKKIKDRLAKNRVRDFEIYLESKEGTNLEVKDGARDVYEVKKGLGFGLRILKDDRIGFSYGSDFSTSAIDFVIERCRQSLAYQNKNKCHRFAIPKPLPSGLTLADPAFHNVSFDDKMALLACMERAALAMGGPVSAVSYTSLDDEYETVLLENTCGLRACRERSVFSAAIGVKAKKGACEEIAYEIQSRMCFSQIDPVDLAQKAARHAVALLGGRPLSNYKGPVVLHHEVVVEFLDMLGSSFLGENVFKKNSFLVGKRGKRIYSDKVQLVDDGLLPGGMATSPFDDEGSPRQTTVLVDAGVIRGFLYDLFWGGRAGEGTTGNASRDNVTSRPGLAHSNLYLKAGKKTRDELLQEMGDGILVTDVMGVHNADESSGTFSVGIQGLTVRNGRTGRAIRSNVLSGNVHTLFARIADVGSDLRFYGTLGAPSLLVAEVEISG